MVKISISKEKESGEVITKELLKVNSDGTNLSLKSLGLLKQMKELSLERLGNFGKEEIKKIVQMIEGEGNEDLKLLADVEVLFSVVCIISGISSIEKDIEEL